ncbi:MAG TPA: hypothetical protein VF814_12560 [Casimicrobiaceae bacterium]
MALLTGIGAGFVWAEGAAADPAAALQAKYAALRDELSRSPFQKPLYLESTETPNALKGDIHAVVDYPFAAVSAALDGADRWCDILILHLNIKGCRAAGSAPEGALEVYVGRKFDEPLTAAHPLQFDDRIAAAAPDYFRVVLAADRGPFGTRNYRIELEALPLDDARAFVHLSYAYGYGAAAKLAMQTYLRTIGDHKVGFTVVGQRADGECASTGCAEPWNATPCATTSRWTLILPRCRSRRRNASRSGCAQGGRRLLRQPGAGAASGRSPATARSRRARS